MINIPKGTKDLLPQESYKWQYIEKTAREVAKTFGVSEIRTPTFEYTELFSRGVGDSTDIVNKEMYTFLDKGERSITLKPEGTAGVARAFVENGLINTPLPCKTFYITSCFRYERPQAGRLREFHQIGIEFLGSKTPDIDVEAILFAKTFFEKLNVKDLQLFINSIGCKECRPKYEKALKEYLQSNLDKLCNTCKERFEKNPLRILDCKNEDCIEIVKNAPSILDFLCDDCKNHFEKVKALLTSFNVDYKINPKIVRGLDYYTKTVFEFVSTNIGAKGTVCGGGRYDGLIKEIGGTDTSGIGFALGIERLVLLLDALGIDIPNENKVEVYIAPMGEETYAKCFALTMELRNLGIVTEIDHMERGIKSQFKYADKIGAKIVAVLGSDEFKNNQIKVKEMATGNENFVDLKDFVDYVKKVLQ